MLSEQAWMALIELDAGRQMNCLHTVSRELIGEGLAFDGWGKLEITESGRRVARRQHGARLFTADNPNVANMGDRNEAMWTTPVNSHPGIISELNPAALRCPCPACRVVEHASGCAVHNLPAMAVGPCDCGAVLPALKIRREFIPDVAEKVGSPPFEPEKLTCDQVDEHAGRPIVWDRERARAAAGVANGVAGVWVEERWVTAFMEAYENERQ